MAVVRITTRPAALGRGGRRKRAKARRLAVRLGFVRYFNGWLDLNTGNVLFPAPPHGRRERRRLAKLNRRRFDAELAGRFAPADVVLKRRKRMDKR